MKKYYSRFSRKGVWGKPLFLGANPLCVCDAFVNKKFGEVARPLGERVRGATSKSGFHQKTFYMIPEMTPEKKPLDWKTGARALCSTMSLKESRGTMVLSTGSSRNST